MIEFSFESIPYRINDRGKPEDSTVYLELTELTRLKPKPILFAVQHQSSGRVEVSMHREALPYPVFKRFVEEMDRRFAGQSGHLT